MSCLSCLHNWLLLCGRHLRVATHSNYLHEVHLHFCAVRQLSCANSDNIFIYSRLYVQTPDLKKCHPCFKMQWRQLCVALCCQEHTTSEIQEHRLASWYSVCVCFNVSIWVKLKNLQFRIFPSVIHFFLLASCSFAINASQSKDIDCLCQPAV